MVMRAISSIRRARDRQSAPALLPSWLPFTLRGWALCHPTANYRGTDRHTRTVTLAMTDVTEVRIDTDARETMTGTRNLDRAAEVQAGGGNHEHVARARNIRHTVAQNHLLLREMGTVRDNSRALTGVTVVDTVAEAQTTWRGVYPNRAF